MQIWDEKKKKKKKRYFFLFNDILLLCRREGKKRYWLRIHITLRSPHVNVENIENASFNNEFRLHCRSRSFIIYAISPDLRKEWLQDLQYSISGTHPEEKKDSKKDDNDDDKKKEDKKDVTKIKKEKGEKKETKREESEDEDSGFEDEEEKETKPRKQAKEPEEQKRQNKSSNKKKKKNPKKEGDYLLPPIVAFDPFGPNPNANKPQTVNPFAPTGGMTSGPMTSGPQNVNPFLPSPGLTANPSNPFGVQSPALANQPFGSNPGPTLTFNNTGNFGVAPFPSNYQLQPGVQPVNPFMAQAQPTTAANPFGSNPTQAVVNPFANPSVGSNQTFGSYSNPNNNPLF